MKKSILIWTSLLLFFSCKKESELNQFKKKISGVWEQEKATGLVTITLPPGNGQIVVIKEDGGFERKKHDTLLFQGVYSLATATDCSPRADDTLMQTNDGAAYYVNLENEKLVLSTSNCVADGGGAIYRRIQ